MYGIDGYKMACARGWKQVPDMMLPILEEQARNWMLLRIRREPNTKAISGLCMYMNALGAVAPPLMMMMMMTTINTEYLY